MNKTILTALLITSITNLALAIGGDTTTVEKQLKNRVDIVFHGGFEEDFNNEEWAKKWGIDWSARAGECEISDESKKGDKALLVKYPKGGLGPQGTGTQFPIIFRMQDANEKGHYQQLYLRYYLKFEEGFDFTKGGKLPGLMGGIDSWTRSGGNQPDGTNGWTLRFMWRENGKIVVYAYVPKSENEKWGATVWGQDIDCDFVAKPGKWVCIEQFVDVGSAGQDDGTLKVWINGELKLDINDMNFGNVDNDAMKIGGIYFSTFHGGNTPDYIPQNDSFILFDGLVAAEKRVGE